LKVQKSETNFLTGKFAQEHDVSEITIKEEFVFKSQEFDGRETTRLTGGVDVDGNESGQKIWSMSATNQNIVIELFGDDTKNWIGKKFAINVPKVNTPKGMQFSVQVDERRTKTIN